MPEPTAADPRKMRPPGRGLFNPHEKLPLPMNQKRIKHPLPAHAALPDAVQSLYQELIVSQYDDPKECHMGLLRVYDSSSSTEELLEMSRLLVDVAMEDMYSSIRLFDHMYLYALLLERKATMTFNDLKFFADVVKNYVGKLRQDAHAEVSVAQAAGVVGLSGAQRSPKARLHFMSTLTRSVELFCQMYCVHITDLASELFANPRNENNLRRCIIHLYSHAGDIMRYIWTMAQGFLTEMPPEVVEVYKMQAHEYYAFGLQWCKAFMDRVDSIHIELVMNFSGFQFDLAVKSFMEHARKQAPVDAKCLQDTIEAVRVCVKRGQFFADHAVQCLDNTCQRFDELFNQFGGIEEYNRFYPLISLLISSIQCWLMFIKDPYKMLNNKNHIVAQRQKYFLTRQKRTAAERPESSAG